MKIMTKKRKRKRDKKKYKDDDKGGGIRNESDRKVERRWRNESMRKKSKENKDRNGEKKLMTTIRFSSRKG